MRLTASLPTFTLLGASKSFSGGGATSTQTYGRSVMQNRPRRIGGSVPFREASAERPLSIHGGAAGIEPDEKWAGSRMGHLAGEKICNLADVQSLAAS